MNGSHTHGATRDRFAAAVITVAAAAVLAIACWLNPAPAGMGTHTQLGMAPCGMLRLSGIPCATCGMTTSFTYAAHGRLWDAFVTQPAGAILAVMTAMLLLVGVYAVVTGMPVMPLLNRLVEPRWFVMMGVVVAIAWVYKIVVVMQS